jgi:PHD/YefM family antitoxin component YafN of YafNO toxin-antitoxin module
MATINATQVKQYVNELLDKAVTEPVVIQKHHKDFAVLLSSDRYQELLAYENNCLNAGKKNIGNFKTAVEKLNRSLSDAQVNEDELISEFRQLRAHDQQ